MKKTALTLFLLLSLGASAQPNYNFKAMKMEKLGRGVVAIRENSKDVFVSWRYLSSDPMRYWKPN